MSQRIFSITTGTVSSLLGQMSGGFALIIGNAEYMNPKLAKLTAPGKDPKAFALPIPSEQDP